MKRSAMISALSLAAILGGCVSGADRPDYTASTAPLETVLGNATSRSPSPSQRTRAALDLPPEAGAFTAVYEKRAVNVQRQDIRLSGSASGLPVNRMEIVAVRSDGRDDDPNIGALKPSESGIAAEMKARLDGIAMQVVVRQMHNDYGPFGLAVGQSARGARCIYAWQWIDDVGTADRGLVQSSLFGSRTRVSASVRINLCRADKTADQLAAYVERLHIDFARLQPSGRPVTEPVVATAFTSQPTVSKSPSQSPRAHRHARRKPSAVAAAKSRPAAEPTESIAAADQPPAVMTRSSVASRRAGFVQAPGDPTPEAGRGSGGAGVPLAPSGAGTPAPLDPSLPPQAYLGPSARAKTSTSAASTIAPTVGR